MSLRNAVFYVASASESRTNEVVWGAMIGGRTEALVVLHSNTPGYERNLTFLSQWNTRAQRLLAGQAVPQSPLEQHFFNWVRHEWTPGACAHVLKREQVGFSLFLQGFEVNRAALQGINPFDPNALLVQLDCRHSNTKLLGFLPAPAVALQRLSDVHQAGGKPVAAALVQAGPLLLENRGYSGAVVVVFSFDPRIDPATLQATADMLAQGKWGELADERFEPGSELLQASDVQWQHGRRVRLPARSPAELEFYVADLWVPREFLIDGFLSPRQPRLLPCLATAGEHGAVELLPYDRITHFWPAAAAAHFLPRG